MDHKILTNSASYYRKQARAHIGGGWVSLAIAVAFFMILMSIVDFVLHSIFHQNVITNFISFIYSVSIFGPAAVGIFAYCVATVREPETPSPTLAFSGFENVLRSFSLGFQMMVRILLWALLLVIPGIIAAYRYCMAPMILRDRPDLSPTECIEESKRIMNGNKGKLFITQLSLIGWIILAGIPLGIAQQNDNGAPWFTLIILVCYIPTLFVLGYADVIEAVFYQELIGPAVHFETEDMGYNYNQEI